MHVAHWIDRIVERTPHKTALRHAGRDISYERLARRIDEVARALAGEGVRRGDRVAWLGLNSAAFLATLFACARLGAIFVPLNWRLAAPEHRDMLAGCTPHVLVVDAEFVAASEDIAPPGAARVIHDGDAAGWHSWPAWLDAAASQPLPPVLADDDAPLLLCHTSGSTGRPKGALLSSRALEANADNADDMHGLVADDHVLTTLPLFHVGGLNIQTLPALRAGCTVTLQPKFDPAATLHAIEHEGITLTVLVPAQLEVLFAHPRWPQADLSGLRAIATGSTTVPLRIVQAVQARGVPLLQVWGATETAPIAACLHADEAWRKPGSAGRAARRTQLRIVGADGRDAAIGQPGEVCVRGDHVMSGYWRDPEASARALDGGWFRSGDLGHLDADGYLSIDGRLKDMIISGGENVSPAEVEAVLLDCPQIAEAAVVGRPDARWGEVVVAVVVPAAGSRIERERVLALCDGRLARFKHPKDVVVLDALPRTALGKVRKDDLRQLVARGNS